MSKRVHTGTSVGKGIGVGHGGNTFNLPLIREVEDWTKGKPLPGSIQPNSHYFRMGTELSIIVSHTEQFGWHMSMAHRKRYPTWDEIAYARYQLIPDQVTMAMMLPSKKDYINLHNNCFQLHEVRDDPNRAFELGGGQ